MSTSSYAHSATPEPLTEPTDCHTAHFATRWLQPETAVITAHGELDAANAQEFVDYALRHAAHTDRLVLDLTGVEFFGTAGFSALHSVNVRCAGEKIEWAWRPAQPSPGCCGSAIPIRPCRSATASTPRCRPCRANRVGYCNLSRSRASDFANKRDTCICEMPTRSAICVCVNDSKNRSTSTVRSRSGKRSEQGPQRFPVLDLIQAEIDIAERVGNRRRILAAAAAAVDRQCVVGAARDKALDHLVAVHVQLGSELGRGGRAAKPL